MGYIMSTLTVRISQALRRELEKLCRLENRTLSEVVRQSISHYLAFQRFASLRKKTLFFAEAQGYLTDEDVFKAVS